jgi:hypothetical protein
MLLGLGLLVVCLGACRSPWTVVRQAKPNPFLGANDFVMTSLALPQARPAHLADEPERLQKHEEDREAMVTLYAATLRARVAGDGVRIADAATAQAPFVIRPTVTLLKLGRGWGGFGSPTELHMTVELLDDKQQVLDDFRMFFRRGTDIYHASTGGILRDGAERLGEVTAQYLRKRIAK